MKREVKLITLAFILAVTAPAHQAIGYYQIIDLGTLGGNSSEARSINDSGQIVGSAQDSSGYTRAVLFDPTGGGHNIILSWHPSYANSINDNGQIVGSENFIATLFDPTGGGKNINLGGGYAYSINNNGQIVGSENLIATLFDPTGGGNNIDLGTLDGLPISEAYSINNQGQIVGYAVSLHHIPIIPRNARAILFDPTGSGNNIDLGTLGGWGGEAWSINDNGQIVGYAPDSSGHIRATLFDPTGGGNNIDLGTLGGRETIACSINDNGQIVGVALALDSSGYYYRAALFDPTGGGNNIDLNTLIDPSLGWTLEYAYSINDNGWIVGYGINPAGYERAYLLIPEPATLSILAAGALFLLRKRRWVHSL